MKKFEILQESPTFLISCVQLSGTLWPIALQDPLSMEFSRQEYWSGFPLRGSSQPSYWTCVLCVSLLSWRADSLPLNHLGSPNTETHEERQSYWKNGVNRLAGCKVATNLQFVRSTISERCHELKNSKTNKVHAFSGKPSELLTQHEWISNSLCRVSKARLYILYDSLIYKF